MRATPIAFSAWVAMQEQAHVWDAMETCKYARSGCVISESALCLHRNSHITDCPLRVVYKRKVDADMNKLAQWTQEDVTDA